MSALPRVAWIGLGIMGGHPWPKNLLKAGYSVTGHTLEAHKLDRLAASGGTAAASVREAVRGADVVVTMLPGSPDVEAVAHGEDGILAHAAPGTLLVDMSSVDPRTSVALAAAAAPRRIRVLDAPVSGGEAGAVEGSLSIMVGGGEGDFDEARPLFAALGTTIVRCGPHGSRPDREGRQPADRRRAPPGRRRSRRLPAEGRRRPRRRPRRARRRSRRVGRPRPQAGQLPRPRVPPGFRIDLHHKDMGIVTTAARALGAALPVGGLVAQLIAAARAQGDGHLDHSALLRGVERLSGVAS
ncbi:2-hydroxy-3-oxopropionate reductase [Streptomyces olivoverticillatus]